MVKNIKEIVRKLGFLKRKRLFGYKSSVFSLFLLLRKEFRGGNLPFLEGLLYFLAKN